jgi:cyclomaltodextrinase / maltogenic alpha-amylase / neopullulanase
MNFNRCYLLAFLFFVSCPVNAEAEGGIDDLIQPVKVIPGKQDTILISDMFYSKTYDLKFIQNDKLAVVHDQVNNTVIFQPRGNFTGAALVDFVLNGFKYSIPVIVRSEKTLQQMHTFIYKPEGSVSKIAVAGTFNNWDKSRDRLLKTDTDSLFRLTLSLDPGNYLYKFIVDGKEVLDPVNPEKSPTGFDNFSSVLRVADIDTGRLFLHIGGRKAAKDRISFSFVYENTADSSRITVEDVIAAIDNNRIDEARLKLDSNRIEIGFRDSELNGEKVLRVMVSHQGRVTNIQQVILRNGIPAGGNWLDWSWYDGVIYSIMIDRFSDGDRSNDKPVVHDSIFFPANYQGGDFKGISRKIDEGYFDSLGISVLWISPVYDNPDVAYREYPPPHRWYSGYHGYWPISEKKVEEKFGTMNELKDLVKKAHKHGIKVLLDFVAHHVHIDHPFYKDHPGWFGTLDLPDGRKNLRLWDEQRLTTWFEPYMPSFDYTKSEEAIKVVSDNAIWWLTETGADGFRHDAVKHVPNKFWRTLTTKLKEEIEIPMHKKVYQIGETFGDYDLIASYVNNGQLSAQFNFNLSYYAIPVFLEQDRSFSFIDFHMKKSFTSFGYNNLMGNIMDSHDKVRYMAYADGKVKNQGIDMREMAWKNPPTVDHPSSYRKAVLYLAYMFTIPGLPVVYYGSEFGMTGADDPDNRRMMRFGDQLSIFEKQMLGETEKIVKIRNQHSSLRYGDFLTLQADSGIYSYIRSDMNERMLVVLNKSEGMRTVVIQLPEMYNVQKASDILSGEKLNAERGSVSVQVAPIGWRVFSLQ